MTGYTLTWFTLTIWRYITPMLLILTFSSILTVGILDGFRYEVWAHRSVSICLKHFIIIHSRQI